MKKEIKEIWLFSQYLGGSGGTNTVVNEVKKTLSEAGVTFRHAWVTGFSVKLKKRENQKLYFKALPIPVYLNNLLAGLKWRYNLKRPPAALALGGSPVSAAIPFAANIPYGMWIGTSLFDEYKTRYVKEEFSNRNYSLVLNKLFLKLNKLSEYCVLKKSRFIIVQSPYIIKSIEKDYSIEREKIEYIPYPVRAKTKIKRKSFNRRGPRLLAVGRVDDTRKNYSLLLKAFRFLVKRYPESRLRIVGRFSSTSKLLKKCTELGLNSVVNFLGEISPEELAKEYEKANIFVLTPRQEGLGIVYLEAMSYGLPVVTTKCGGPEGTVINGVNGCLVEQDDLNAFVNAIEQIWDSEKTYRELSAQAYNYILETHNPEKFRKRFIGILQSKLGAP